jgi:hypothetical protein
MPLPTFDSKDAVPEAFRDAYVEREGKWVLDDSESKGLKDSHRRLLDEKKRVDGENAKIREALGDLTPEQAAEVVKQYRLSEEERQKKAGEHDKIIEKRVNETKAEYEKRLKVVEDERNSLRSDKLENAIRKGAMAANVRTEDIDDVVELVRGKRVRIDDGTGKIVVYDADGDPTGLTVEKFFAETYKTERPKYYGAAGGSGGGSTGGNAGNGGTRSGASGTVSVTDQTAFLANVKDIARGKVKATA